MVCYNLNQAKSSGEVAGMKNFDEKKEDLIISGNVGNKIKKARLAKGINQKTLAQLCEVSPQAVSGWEREEALPSPDKRPLLCEILGVDVKDLFFDNPDDTGIFFAPFYCDEDGKRKKREEKYPLPVNFIDKPLNQNSIICAYNKGDAMNEMLSDGAIVAVDTKSKKIENGALYLVNINEQVEVRSLSLNKEGLNVKCLNSKYETLKLNTQQLAIGTFSIIGKVFWYANSIR